MRENDTRFCSAEVLGKELELKPSTILKLARKGIIPRKKISKKIVRFDRQVVYQALEAVGE